MEFIKWQNVIVEWVNCLNLSKPVENISELKNENFFRTLLQVLIKTDSSEDVCLTDFLKKHYPSYYLESESTLMQDDAEICNVYSLLLHYCCYIDSRTELTAPMCQNLNSNTQLFIKLFLEYMSDSEIITRDVLNDAILCINKSNSTPIKLTSPKHLQSTSTSLLDFLKTPLKKQQVLESHKREIITLQAQIDFERFEKGDLQEELNLQYDKNKKLEKVISDKQSEISKLRSELLNLETFSPPPNSETDNREHKRLKDEIQSLETYVSILHKEQEDLQNERDRARDKLGKIEENIQEWQTKALILERQNLKLNEENEEQKYELCQLREKCDELSSILKEVNARNVCDESYEIDHVHEHLHHNRSGSIDYDNLAHTVVDVQLIDAQEENKNLRRQIGDLELNTTVLTEQLNAFHNEISKIMSDNKSLLDKVNDIESNNAVLKSKLSETELNSKYYQNENDNLVKNFDNLQLEKFDLETKLQEFRETNSKLTTSFASLNENLAQLLQKSIQKFSLYFKENLYIHPDAISNLENLFSNLEIKINNDTQECENLSQKVAYLEEDILSSQKEKENMQRRMQNLQEESIKNDKLIIICKNSIEEKTNEINYLQKALKQREQTVENMQLRISDLSSLAEDMESTINNLKCCVENDKRELEQHKISLKVSQAKVEENNKIFENMILNSDKLIDELKKEKLNLLSNIQTIENISQEDKAKMQELEVIIEEKTREIFQLRNEQHHLMSQIEDIEEKLRDEKGEKEKLNLKLQTSECQFEYLRVQVDEEKSSLNSLLEDIEERLKNETLERQKIAATCETLKTEINEKETTIQNTLHQKMELEKVINGLNEDIVYQKESKIAAEQKCEDLQKLIQDIEGQSQIIRTQFEDFILASAENFQKHINNLNSKLASAEVTNQTLKMNLEDMTKAVEKKYEEIEELKEEKRVLRNQNEEIENFLCEEKKDKEYMNTKLQNAELIIAELKIKIEELKEEKRELQKQKEDIENFLCEEKKNKEYMSTKLQNAELIIAELKIKIEELKEEKRELQKQKEDIENFLCEEKKNKEYMSTKLQNAELLIAELKIKIEERNKCFEEINKEKLNLSSILRETEAKLVEEELCKKIIEENCIKIRTNLTEKENIIEILENQKEELNKNIEDLNKEILLQRQNKSEIESKCGDLQKIITDIEAQMKMLKVDKSKLLQQFEDMKKISSDNLQKHQENLGLKIQMLKKELENAEEANESLKTKLEDMNKAIQEKLEQISTLEHEKIKCESVIVKLNEEIVERNAQKLLLETELNNLNKSLNEKDIVINNLTSQKNNIEEQLASINNHLTTQLNEKSTELQQHFQNVDLINLELSTIIKMFESEEDIHETGDNNLLSKLTTVKNSICNVIFEKRGLENEITTLQQQIVLSENLKSTSEDEYTKTITTLQQQIVLSENLKSTSEDEYTKKITEYKNKLKDYEENLEQTAENVQKLIKEHEKELQIATDQQNSLIRELDQTQVLYTKSLEVQKEMQSTNNDLQKSNTNLTEKINELNTKLTELDFEKNNLNLQLDDLNFKMNILEQTREQITAEMEQSLKDSQENLSELLRELQEEKNKNIDLITICKEHFNKFSDLYLNLFENDYNKDVVSEINKIKDQKELSYVKIKNNGELINKLFEFISNEISNLKKTAKQMSNYETLKSDLESLKHKFELSLNTEDENSKLNLKISDLNLEIAKYKQQISEKQLDKSKYEKEIEIMKTTCDNWQKVLKENETEHKKLHNEFQNLKEKYQVNNEKLQTTVVDLQQQIKSNNNVITEHENKYEELFKKYSTAQEKINSIDPEILNLQTKITNYKKIIADLEEKNKVLTQTLNEYAEMRAENSKLHLDCQVLRKTVEERNSQLGCLTHIKDSYEKLLEENNKVNMELDTLRYKRTRDKEEFKRILEEQSGKSNEQIQVVRNEYEEKLKKMKEKIVKLYREEVEKEKKKVCTLQQGQAEDTISALKSQLWVTGNKYVDLKKEYEKLASQVSKMKSIESCNDVHGSRNSLHSLPNFPPDNNLDDRRTSTLPRDTKIELIEESVTISRKRRSITAVSGLQMEDEQGEIFNNTYLADLKAGRCIVSDSRDSVSSTSSRMSELQYRNSLCPPHLKSSYPLETQFSSPGHFKEDDIKQGNADLDDSVTVLLPGERPKKKGGQTLYKKPGPPTPSKHGGQGRLSFQGGEVAPLREQNPPAASQGPRNSSTPSRIRALFSRSGRETENVTPRGPTKRRSIFRR